MHPDGLDRLRIAVVRQTARDYLEALRVLRHNNRKSHCYCHAEYMIASCETFFRDDCDYFMAVDGMALMERLKEKSYDPDFWVRMED